MWMYNPGCPCCKKTNKGCTICRYAHDSAGAPIEGISLEVAGQVAFTDKTGVACITGLAANQNYEVDMFYPNGVYYSRESQFIQPDCLVVGCPCGSAISGGTPSVLDMAVEHQELNAQNFRPSTLTYGPTPTPLLPLHVGDFNWYSNQTFVDTTTLDKFRYLFRCEQGMYVLRRVFETSIYGSPFMTPGLYVWIIGFPGNHCQTDAQTFLLSRGDIYVGGDPSTQVTISGG